jgi:NAD(P)-dependent dehydrogenase (short-subunit alcohol dehydrogenase family)
MDLGGEGAVVTGGAVRLGWAMVLALAERPAAHFGRVDPLADNAPICEGGGRDETTELDWDAHFVLNLEATFFLSRAFARQTSPRIGAGSGEAG